MYKREVQVSYDASSWAFGGWGCEKERHESMHQGSRPMPVVFFHPFAMHHVPFAMHHVKKAYLLVGDVDDGVVGGREVLDVGRADHHGHGAEVESLLGGMCV